MKKKYWPVIVILVLAAVAVAIWLYPKTPKPAQLSPHVSIASVVITELNNDTVKLSTRILLSNPLPADINSHRLHYELFIDSVRVLSSSYEKPLLMKAGDSGLVDIPVEIPVQRLASVLKRFERENTDSALYTVRSQLELDLPVAGERELKFEFSKRYPAIRIPAIRFVETDLKKLGFSESSLDLVIGLDNPNLFAIRLKAANLHVLIDNSMQLEGVLRDPLELPAKGADTIPVHLDVQTPKLGKLAWKALFDKKHTQLSLQMDATSTSDLELLNNTRIRLRLKGTLAELLQLANKVENTP